MAKARLARGLRPADFAGKIWADRLCRLYPPTTASWPVGQLALASGSAPVVHCTSCALDSVLALHFVLADSRSRFALGARSGAA